MLRLTVVLCLLSCVAARIFGLNFEQITHYVSHVTFSFKMACRRISYRSIHIYDYDHYDACECARARKHMKAPHSVQKSNDSSSRNNTTAAQRRLWCAYLR